MANFSVPSRRLPILVTGPLQTSPYEIAFQYGSAAAMIKSAHSCQQTVSYSCNKTTGGVVSVYVKSASAPVADNQCSSCVCKLSQSADTIETETFTDKNKLPIQKITVADMTTFDQKIYIKVGDVNCEECKEFIFCKN